MLVGAFCLGMLLMACGNNQGGTKPDPSTHKADDLIGKWEAHYTEFFMVEQCDSLGENCQKVKEEKLQDMYLEFTADSVRVGNVDADGNWVDEGLASPYRIDGDFLIISESGGSTERIGLWKTQAEQEAIRERNPEATQLDLKFSVSVTSTPIALVVYTIRMADGKLQLVSDLPSQEKLLSLSEIRWTALLQEALRKTEGTQKEAVQLALDSVSTQRAKYAQEMEAELAESKELGNSEVTEYTRWEKK